jgi:heterodisulfide reductase subunit C
MPSPVTIVLPKKESVLYSQFWDQVSSFPGGHKIRNCIQCGSCTGSCPISHAMDVTPRQIVALFRAGFLEDVLRSNTIWMCASCYACTVRCPVGIRVTDTLYALKRLGHKKKILPRRVPVSALSDAFCTNIRTYGRNWEVWLGLKYYLRAEPKKLFSLDLARFALRLITRRRLALRPARVERIGEVRAIIDKAVAMGGL